MDDLKELSFSIDMDMEEPTFPQTLGMSIDRAREIGEFVYNGRHSGEYKSHPELLEAVLKECNSYAEALFASYAVGNLTGIENARNNPRGLFGGNGV